MIKKIIGFLMVMSVFASITLWMSMAFGWKETLLVWIGAIAVTAIIVKGIELMHD